MNSRPHISIVIPAWNAAQWLGEAISSCLRQQYEPLEIIVVDDGSDDNTYSVATNYAQCAQAHVRVFRTQNAGPSAARNFGAALAQGEYILFLDADDILGDQALTYLGAAAARTNADAVVGVPSNLDRSPGDEQIVPRRFHYHDSYANAARQLWVHSSVLFRRIDLKWNEARSVWEGLEYILDFLTADCLTSFEDRAVVRIRQHNSVYRISNRINHFEPRLTGEFFAEQKQKLRKSCVNNLERESALDFHILGNAYALLRSGRPNAANYLLETVNWKQIAYYDWYHTGSLAWAGHWLGPKFGTRSFFYVNRMLGRA